MANNDDAVLCQGASDNTGTQNFCRDFGLIVKPILCPVDWSIPLTEAQTEAGWVTQLQALPSARVYPVDGVMDVDNENEETQYDEGAVSKVFIRDGKTIYTAIVEVTRYGFQQLVSHSNKPHSVVFVDDNEFVQGINKDVGSVQHFGGVNLETFTVEKYAPVKGGEAMKCKLVMVLGDPNSWYNSPSVVNGKTFKPSQFNGLENVLLGEEGTSTTSQVIIGAEVYRTGTEVLGANETPGTDLIVKDSTGATETPTSITDNSDGTYTFAFGTPLAAGTYTFDFVPSQSMELKGYESLGPATVVLS